MKLSYHGLRAKDNSFSCRLNFHLDDHIGKINIVPQDVGRVLLNLCNNAFYAVMEKKRILNGSFEPAVSLTTVLKSSSLEKNAQIEIRIRDNGLGIPEKIMEKIFQPFFTTKPTGQGTGLGLSMSYDIITKTHGGKLWAETYEGEFTEFIIHLPL